PQARAGCGRRERRSRRGWQPGSSRMWPLPRILPVDGPGRPADDRARGSGADRRGVVYLELPLARLLGDRAFLSRHEHRLVRRSDCALPRADLRARVPARPGGRQAARPDRPDRADRPGRLSRLDGGGDRRPRAPRPWPPRRRAWSDSIAWWTLLVALVLTWIRARLRSRGTRPAPRARSCLVVSSGH